MQALNNERPVFCSKCGDEMYWRFEPSGFDPMAGRIVEQRWWECPRFKPQWRNLWSASGGEHDSFSEDGGTKRRMPWRDTYWYDHQPKWHVPTVKEHSS